MPKKTKSIPLNTWSTVFGEGVVISKASFQKATEFEQVGEPHRDDWHLFILQEKGVTTIEIDFETYEIKSPAVIYIHPNQVHRLLAFNNASLITWAINDENINPEYLKLLEDLTPVKPLPLDQETFTIITETALLGVKYTERKKETLYHALLKDNCNTLVALVISQYLAQSKSTVSLSRYETITKAFKAKLEQDFKTEKSPSAYASSLNISTAYLNECVKNTTGQPVSIHIQQRVILEAERLLYHSNKSVKEIAAEMGYDDYSYFTRFFTRNTGLTPLAFRNKNHE